VQALVSTTIILVALLITQNSLRCGAVAYSTAKLGGGGVGHNKDLIAFLTGSPPPPTHIDFPSCDSKQLPKPTCEPGEENTTPFSGDPVTMNIGETKHTISSKGGGRGGGYPEAPLDGVHALPE